MNLDVGDTLTNWELSRKILGLDTFTGCLLSKGNNTISSSSSSNTSSSSESIPSNYCRDKYYYQRTLDLGYESFLWFGPVVVLCTERCSTVRFNTTCPPVELRNRPGNDDDSDVFNNDNNHHHHHNYCVCRNQDHVPWMTCNQTLSNIFQPISMKRYYFSYIFDDINDINDNCYHGNYDHVKKLFNRNISCLSGKKYTLDHTYSHDKNSSSSKSGSSSSLSGSAVSRDSDRSTTKIYHHSMDNMQANVVSKKKTKKISVVTKHENHNDQYHHQQEQQKKLQRNQHHDKRLLMTHNQHYIVDHSYDNYDNEVERNNDSVNNITNHVGDGDDYNKKYGDENDVVLLISSQVLTNVDNFLEIDMYKRFLNVHNSNYSYSNSSSSNDGDNNTHKHMVIIDIDPNLKHRYQKCIQSSCLYEKINNIHRLLHHYPNSSHNYNHKDHYDANKHVDNGHNDSKENNSNIYKHNYYNSIAIDNMKFPFDNTDDMIFQRKISEFLTISYMSIDMHKLKSPNTVVLNSCETNDYDSGRSSSSSNSNCSSKSHGITIGFIYCDEMLLLNEAYDHNEINRWIIDQAIILNNQLIYNIILIIIGGSSSNNTLYIIQNVKDYITMTIILSDYDYIDDDHSISNSSSSSSSSSSSGSGSGSSRISSSSSSNNSSHLHRDISCKGLYYDTKSWRYMKIYMNTYKKKKYGGGHHYHHHNHQQQQQYHSHYSNEYNSNYRNGYNQEVGIIKMNFMKQNKLQIRSDTIMI